jgi:hypothetical protein
LKQTTIATHITTDNSRITNTGNYAQHRIIKLDIKTTRATFEAKMSDLNVIGNFSIVDGDFQLALAGLRGVDPELAGLTDDSVSGFGYANQPAKRKVLMIHSNL